MVRNRRPGRDPARRARTRFLAAALLASLARECMVVMLADRGWWFVQEKVLLGLLMLEAAGFAAVLIADQRLLEASRTPNAKMPT